jgi:hypothetical protein
MKYLILTLLLALTCSISFAKDGPFPHKMAGIWASQNSPYKVSVQVRALKSGNTLVMVMVTDNTGECIADGQAVISPEALSATVNLSDVNGRTFPLTVRLFATEGKARLIVMSGEEALVFSRLP